MSRIRVLDIFSGMGGFSFGFANRNYSVTGADVSEVAGITYHTLTSGRFLRTDLKEDDVQGEFDVVIGGPPCKPWSPVNLTRRGDIHRDYDLLGRYVDHVASIKPMLFILENVPILKSDPGFQRQMKRLARNGYSIGMDIFRYSDYGASTARRRLFVAGLLNDSGPDFIKGIQRYKSSYRTVRHAIGGLKKAEKGRFRDHVWPELKTIHKYRDYYLNGKYGWTVLKWSSPAPSFGNVMKTYTLHPDSDIYSGHTRVVSVLEVSKIMGFNHGFQFPKGLGIGERYQMLADSVSPVFSDIVARHVAKSVRF